MMKRSKMLKTWRSPQQKIADEEIIFLRNIGFSVKEISESTGVSYPSVSTRHARLVREGYINKLPTGYSAQYARKKFYEDQRDKRVSKIIFCLSSTGPMFLKDLLESCKIPRSTGVPLLKEKMPDKITWIELKIGVSGARNVFRSFKLFDGIASIKKGPIISLKGDERIIKFLSSRLPRVENKQHAKSLSQRLKGYLGKEITIRVVEACGYKYKTRDKNHIRAIAKAREKRNVLDPIYLAKKRIYGRIGYYKRMMRKHPEKRENFETLIKEEREMLKRICVEHKQANI